MTARRTLIREQPNPFSAAEIARRGADWTRRANADKHAPTHESKRCSCGDLALAPKNRAERIVMALEVQYPLSDVLAYVNKRIADFSEDLEPENAQSIGHAAVQRSIGRVAVLEEVRNYIAAAVADELAEPER